MLRVYVHLYHAHMRKNCEETFSTKVEKKVETIKENPKKKSERNLNKVPR